MALFIVTVLCQLIGVSAGVKKKQANYSFAGEINNMDINKGNIIYSYLNGISFFEWTNDLI